MSDFVHRPALSSGHQTHCTSEQYDALYRQSVEDPDGFWLDQAKRLDWYSAPTKGGDWSYDPVEIEWFADGKLNLCYNAVDRHLDTRADSTALIFEPDDPASPGRSLTYRELHGEVVGMANALKSLGVRRGDRVTIYMPMVIEGVLAMLACARLGAIHSVVFGGFSPEALAGRIVDCGSRFVVTADEGLRGSKRVPLKTNVDAALEHDGVEVEGVLVVSHTGADIAMKDGRDHWYADLKSDTDCPCEEMGAEDPLFILYTSGSTGSPKGVLHTTGGYGVWTATTFNYTFDYQPGEVFWCSADIGWVTGHSYVVYGPLMNGATSLVFEGVPNYPDHGRFWDVVDKHKVNILYTAPTAIRALMREGDDFVTSRSRASLRLLGSVGEPINPEAWRWYFDVVGEKRCPVIDTWWQTETGGVMITTLPTAHDMKPGSAGLPFFGIQPQLVDNDGAVLDGATEGNLCITHSWPGQARTVYGDHERFVQTYFSTYKGKYFTGDGCRRDGDGYYWITGRVDDVINVSGHRMGTA
ncbi:MAG: acetate--CoA ligase, partial [Sphingomonadaceae bacterium]|nr:acetate--CoA ligase [Sphingomonadaceae bacterium]